MPEYTYVCDNCGFNIDLQFGMNDEKPDIIDCNNCGEKARRKFSVSVKIPEGWGETDMKFDKSPSGKKHIF